MVIKGAYSRQKAAFYDIKSIVRGNIRDIKVTPTVTPTITPTAKNKRKVQGSATAALHR
jgi:hypothetical protein